jgi:hypothetical protein
VPGENHTGQMMKDRPQLDLTCGAGTADKRQTHLEQKVTLNTARDRWCQLNITKETHLKYKIERIRQAGYHTRQNTTRKAEKRRKLVGTDIS